MPSSLGSVYPRPVETRRVELTLFTTRNGDKVLAGRWWNTVNGNAGDWLLRLSANDVPS